MSISSSLGVANAFNRDTFDREQGTVFLKQQKLAAFDSSLRKAFAERIASKSVLNITLIPLINISHTLYNRDASLATF